MNLVDPWGLLGFGDIASIASTVMITMAKVGGLIAAGTAQAIGGIATVAGVFIFPSTLNAGEKAALEHYRTMKEIEELNKQIEDLQRKWEPIMDLFNIDYDWDDGPC